MDIALEKKWVDTPSGRIYYFTTKRFSDRPTVVFLHGLSANHTTWLRSAGRLAAKRINCLLVELRGHGYSDKRIEKKQYELAVFSADLALILNQENCRNFLLVGYSFGGAIALHYALNRTPSPGGLILISANHVNPLKYWRIGWLTPLLRLIVNVLAYSLAWEKRENYSYYEPNRPGGYWQSVWAGLKTMPWSINLWMLREMSALNFYGLLGKIKIPLLIMHSRHDPFLTELEISDMAREIPRAEIVVSKNKSHFVASQSQDEVTEIILEFIGKNYEDHHL
jgi:pimeloyl-ACP methyl ester carboxylesterase